MVYDSSATDNQKGPERPGDPMTRNAVGWFEIYVQDIVRAKAFYETVFQLELNRLNSGDIQMWAFPGAMESPGSPGSLVHMPGFPSGGNSVLVYFSSEDCAVEESRVAAAGGTVKRTKMGIGEYGFVTLVVDTEGNLIGVHSTK
jgi:predicted enzyme related to lactoylglutathione lyase